MTVLIDGYVYTLKTLYHTSIYNHIDPDARQLLKAQVTYCD